MSSTFDPIYQNYINKPVLITHHNHFYNEELEAIDIEVHQNRGNLKNISYPNRDHDRSIIITNFIPHIHYHTFVSSLPNFHLYEDRTMQTKYNMYLFFHHIRHKLYMDVRYVISQFLVYDYEEIIL